MIEERVLHAFSALSILNERLRKSGLSAPEMSRINEYIRIMAVHFEIMKTIRVYRTPGCLRGFTKFFLTIIPIVYGPVFAYIAEESGDIWHGCVLGVLYAVVLTSLDNTQDILENPYDGDLDDIQFTKVWLFISPSLHIFVFLSPPPYMYLSFYYLFPTYVFLFITPSLHVSVFLLPLPYICFSFYPSLHIIFFQPSLPVFYRPSLRCYCPIE
ncbi:hypothetical protein B484DRAFT_202502 [Ochromonadaceae sp. CCMP2298]|nr:hypothetical protein B484DRAFT_202502 [Ochromonadaceae sp. CCMP2298]